MCVILSQSPLLIFFEAGNYCLIFTKQNTIKSLLNNESEVEHVTDKRKIIILELYNEK